VYKLLLLSLFLLLDFKKGSSKESSSELDEVSESLSISINVIYLIIKL